MPAESTIWTEGAISPASRLKRRRMATGRHRRLRDNRCPAMFDDDPDRFPCKANAESEIPEANMPGRYLPDFGPEGEFSEMSGQVPLGHLRPHHDLG